VTCPWPVDPGCLGDEWDNYDPAVQDRAVMLASATLHRLTGYRVGGCPVKVRPCKRSCGAAYAMPAYWDMAALYGTTPYPQIVGGVWINSCGCSTDCSCQALCEIALPPPVGEVQEVMLDGEVTDPADYRVDGNRLVWVGADECPWPVCQDLSAADTEIGTFSVTFLNSYPVDDLGEYAVGVLAAEFAKACIGGKCRLPSGVTQITRQGVSMTVNAGAFPDGLTGIREVDAFIALWNPTPIREAPRVWSPDLRTPRVTG